jgi:hypothetical protein
MHLLNKFCTFLIFHHNTVHLRTSLSYLCEEVSVYRVLPCEEKWCKHLGPAMVETFFFIMTYFRRGITDNYKQIRQNFWIRK